MVSPGHLGVEGKGKAPHWRLTDAGHAGQPPTRDFLHWDGTPFREQKSPKHYISKKQNPVPKSGDTPSLKTGTVPSLKTGTVPAQTVPEIRDITSLPLPVTERGEERGRAGSGVLVVPDDRGIPDFLRRS
jgi:hypothetical protein